MANTLNIWPTSPVPADLERQPMWNESRQKYDSGAGQGHTPYVKPLYEYGVTLQNMERTKQRSLHAFWNKQRGGTIPFLFMDPYDNQVASTQCVRTGTAPTSFWAYTVDSFSVIAQSGSILITSNLSGALTQGSHYILDQDTGIIVASMRPSSGDFWTISCGYYKKVFFNQQYSEVSNVWNNFNGRVSFEELV